MFKLMFNFVNFAFENVPLTSNVILFHSVFSIGIMQIFSLYATSIFKLCTDRRAFVFRGTLSESQSPKTYRTEIKAFGRTNWPKLTSIAFREARDENVHVVLHVLFWSVHI